MILVLTRFRFYAIVSALFMGCLTGVLLVSYLLDRLVPIAWLRGALGLLVLAIGQVAFQVLTGGHTSYRKYVAALGGDLAPPSRFWATTGQLLAVILAAAIVGGVSHAAANASEDSAWRSAAVVVWLVVPGATLIYLLIARDWRRELTSSSNAA
ncbi:MAG: hypothetical protein ACJ79A_04815 [Gemmatimonadaceae bacterium]